MYSLPPYKATGIPKLYAPVMNSCRGLVHACIYGGLLSTYSMEYNIEATSYASMYVYNLIGTYKHDIIGRLIVS